MSQCTVEGCGKKHRAKGLCAMHYHRLQRTGNLGPSPKHSRDRESAFLFRVERDAETGCLVWTGAKQSNGYGVMAREGGGMMLAHRYAWEREQGRLSDEDQIDHICYRRDCVEVSHLRVATYLQNGWNRSGPNRDSATGVRNVYRYGYFRFIVRADCDQVTHERGPFATVDEAAQVAEELRAELFGEFAGRGA